MAGYGPPADPSGQPTRRADINTRAYRPSDQPIAGPPTGSYPAPAAAEPDPAPTPWYRRRVVLIAWGLIVAALVALIVYGLVDLAGRGHGGPTPTHTTTATPTTTTTTATTPTTTSPSPSDTSEEPPANSEAPQAPAPPARPPSGTAPPSRRHHFPKLPPTISVPGGPVITLPGR